MAAGPWFVEPREEETSPEPTASSQGQRRTGADLFCLVSSSGARGNSLKLCQGRFSLDIRERLFPERVVVQVPHGSHHSTKPAAAQDNTLRNAV